VAAINARQKIALHAAVEIARRQDSNELEKTVKR
jgi:hypothetical protein